MTCVIAEPRIDIVDRAWVEECPVDCIYQGARALYIHPDECVDCGACEPVRHGGGVLLRGRRASGLVDVHADNAGFFIEPLPGAAAASGSPGGAARRGRVGVDSPLVAGHPGSP